MSVPTLLIVAGEASADLHGAHLLRALRIQRPDVVPFGVGGEAMRAEGLEVVVRAADISVAGLTEVLTALPRIAGILRRLTQLAAERRPAAAILLDLPDFNLRLAARLKALGIPVVYYISPQVWAWRPKRVHQIRRVVDRMLVILPFEEEFYRRHGVAAEFVGHPLVEELPPASDRQAARVALGLPSGPGPLVALLPGSRKQEIARHLPLMLRAFQRLRARHPAARAIIPVASTVSRTFLEKHLRRASGTDVTLVDGRATEVLTAADAAVVCSGTATLQTALLARPMIVVYRVSWLTYQILKRLVRVTHIALVNLIAGRTLVPELVQGAFTPANVEAELIHLLEDGRRRDALEAELVRLRDKLGHGGASARVAHIVSGYLPAAPTAACGESHG